MDSIKIALVDSEEIFLEGLAEVLRKSLPTNVVLIVHSVNEIVDSSQNSEIPDVVLIGEDTSFPDVLESVKKARELLPASNVATILHPEQNADPVEILKSGAVGCLSKNVSIDDLVSSIRLISTGRIVVSPRFKDRFFKGISPEERDAGPRKDILSDREIEISLLVSQGKTNKEISELLIVTENTVKAHLRNILSKLHFKNRQQLVAYTVLKNSSAVDSPF
jgi:DNA-binding NarL/FixJ family response regulator